MIESNVAVVTGAASGIGASVATLIADAGLPVALLDIDQKNLTRTTRMIDATNSGRAFSLVADVTDPQQIGEAVKKVEETIGPIQFLINSAGIYKESSLMALSLKDWEQILKINLTGTFICCQAVASAMLLRNAGAIVNISSRLGFCGTLNRSAYSASKAGIAGLTRALAAELAPAGIRVNAIAPGIIETPMTQQMRDRQMQNLLKDIPLNRFGRSGEAAQAVWFLLNQPFITGQTLHVNGGSFMA